MPWGSSQTIVAFTSRKGKEEKEDLKSSVVRSGGGV